MENEYRQILEVESTDAYIALFGLNDENISLIREELGVEVFVHGTQIQLSGEEEKVELAKLAISKLLEVLAARRGHRPHANSLLHRAGARRKRGCDWRNYEGYHCRNQPWPPGEMQNAGPAQIRGRD